MNLEANGIGLSLSNTAKVMMSCCRRVFLLGAVLAHSAIFAQTPAPTNREAITNDVSSEGIGLLSATNLESRPGPVKPAHLKVVPHPKGSSTNAPTGIRPGTRKTGPARFFELVKTVFGVGNVIHLFDGKDLDNFYPWLGDS